MPNSRVQNTTPNVGIKTAIPIARVPSFNAGELTAGLTTTITPGMPIGLLLALTYATSIDVVTPPVYLGEFRPNIRITNF